MKNLKAQYTRNYLGVTITGDNYREILSKEGRKGINFHTRHLEAYLSGNEQFPFGRKWNDFWMKWEPIFHKVKQKLTQINAED